MEKEDFIELFEIYRILNKRWAQRWNKVSENGHSVTHVTILEILHSEGRQRASSLANALSITTGGITGIVDKLVKEGLVIKSRDQTDRRVVFIEITEKGGDLLKILSNQRVQLIKEFLSCFSEMELDELMKYNRKLYKHT